MGWAWIRVWQRLGGIMGHTDDDRHSSVGCLIEWTVKQVKCRWERLVGVAGRLHNMRYESTVFYPEPGKDIFVHISWRPQSVSIRSCIFQLALPYCPSLRCCTPQVIEQLWLECIIPLQRLLLFAYPQAQYFLLSTSSSAYCVCET